MSTPSNRIAPSEAVIVGLSGGVDSSVAALLLKRQGYAVGGVFMRNWEEPDPGAPCTAEVDAHDALQVCETLDIELDAVSFAAEYWERVFHRFLEEYARGRTPNPDILCNKEIKFRAFLEHALGRGAEYVATGHYARVRSRKNRYELLKGADPDKDQSYFLYTLGQAQLAHTLFPLGGLHKPQVRRLAAEAGLANHAKKDSTGICFIGERRFRTFLSRYLGERPGEIRTPEGSLLGQHAGLMYYTLGQRRGLGIGGRNDATGEPWFVVGKDLPSNTLLVAQGRDHPWLLSRTVAASELHWVSGEAPQPPFICRAKTRYRQRDEDCVIMDYDGHGCRVSFRRPQWAVTPGQSVVFYQDEICLGGGVIDARCGWDAGSDSTGAWA